MMSKNRIYISRAADCDQIILILARNGYAVRSGKDNDGAIFVEYWSVEND